jgi:hypothetical protein
VVYHHVGDREAVVGLVLEHVVGRLAIPPETLPWREWFENMLADHRTVLRGYPGVALRLANGPPPAVAAPIVDLGVRQLREAGFGDESVLAFSVLMTTAYQYIALEHDPGRNTHLFQYAVQRCLDGLECRLKERVP